MKIYHIEFAKTGTDLSGGEVCMLELIKHFSLKGHQNILLTTDNGEYSYRRNLPPKTNVSYKTINSFSGEKKFGVLISYILRIKLERDLIKRVKIDEDGIVICHSDFFPNSIANWLILKNHVLLGQVLFFICVRRDFFAAMKVNLLVSIKSLSLRSFTTGLTNGFIKF